MKVVNHPPKLTLDMYYNNSFYVEYTKNYNSKTIKTRYIKGKSVQNVLYFDKKNWDSSYFPTKDINSAKKLPVSFFKTLQITFLTKNAGDDFCIRNIEFINIKVKSI